MSHRLTGRLKQAEKRGGITDGADNIPILIVVVPNGEEGRRELLRQEEVFGTDPKALIEGPKSEAGYVTSDELIRNYRPADTEPHKARRRSARRRR